MKEKKISFRNRKNKIKKSKVGLKKEKTEQSWPEEKKRKAKSGAARYYEAVGLKTWARSRVNGDDVTGPELWAGK